MQINSNLEFPLWVDNLNGSWRSILRNGQFRKIPKGTIIGSNYSEKAGFYFLEEGLVKLLFYDSYLDSPSPIIIIREGTLFGEVPEIINSMNATFECLVPCSTYFFPFEKVYNEEFAAKYPNIMLELAHSLSIKMNRILLVLCQRHRYSSSVNVARYLYTMDKYNDQKVLRYCILSHQELASLLGIHRSTLSAILKDLKAKGILQKYTKYNIEISDKNKLAEYILSQIEKKETSRCNIKRRV